jgi:hypothetical protein
MEQVSQDNRILARSRVGQRQRIAYQRLRLDTRVTFGFITCRCPSRFYESVPWWDLEPRPNALEFGAKVPEERRPIAKADAGNVYAIYFPAGFPPAETVRMRLLERTQSALSGRWFNPQTGAAQNHRSAASGFGGSGRPSATAGCGRLAAPGASRALNWVSQAKPPAAFLRI